jgi:hypothetical protein
MNLRPDPYGIRHPNGTPQLAAPDVAVFVPGWNTRGRHDADWFAREADCFFDCHGIQNKVRHPVDNTLHRGRRCNQLLNMMASAVNMAKPQIPQVWAFFMHGTTHALESAGLLSPNHPRADHVTVRQFNRAADLIATHPAPTVILYACSTANDPDGDGPLMDGDGSFADELRDALCARDSWNCRVVAHVGPGDTTRRPHVRILEGTGSREPGEGAQMLFEPGTVGFRRFARWLRDEDGNGRFRYPFLEKEQIRKEIGL